MSPPGSEALCYCMTRVVRAISYSEPSDRLSSSYRDLERTHSLKMEGGGEDKKKASNGMILN